MSFYPKDSHFLLPILVFLNVLMKQLLNMSFYPKDKNFPLPILILRASAARSASKCPPFAAKQHVSSSQGHPFSLAHFNIAR
jgi:hypothetical protein